MSVKATRVYAGVAAGSLLLAGLVGVPALTGGRDAPPEHSCVMEVHLAEDGFWDGHGVISDGVRVAEHWRVADYHLEGTITANEYGTVGLNTVWTPGYKGTACTLVLMTAQAT